MAYYKVPQDVEAEDKLIGPFTFKQFVFLAVFAVTAFLAIALGRANVVLAVPFLPFVIIFGILGLYRPADQPVENKLLAYVNFWFKPRQRIWSRDGIIEHVHIKAPKTEIKYYSDNRTQAQVKSQLGQLAQIVDTRGWSTKRAEIQAPTVPTNDNSDRLVRPEELTRYNQEPVDVHETDDVFEEGNPVSESFKQLSEQASERARQAALERMDEARHEQQTPTPPPTQSLRVQPINSKRLTDDTEPPQAGSITRASSNERSARNKYTSEPTIGVPPSSTPHFDPFPHMHQRVIDPSGSITTKSDIANDNTSDDTSSDDETANEEQKLQKQQKDAYDQLVQEFANSELPVSTVAERANQKEQDSGMLDIAH